MKLFSFLRRIFSGSFKEIGCRKSKRKTYKPLKYKFKKNYGISSSIQKKSVRDHNKFFYGFTKKKKRNPNRIDLGKIIRGASHDTVKYKRRNSGHWKRQKIRHYLFNLHGISYKKR